ncbi:hypothetical protein B0T21DRAFT_407933 [Apiosordaria backusii]|uniref:Cytochrome b561 domain-containing protein n=1 Tax=Apiosordaria backusii TaxID=314023 RepID=A0AA40ESU7_9PEZI|nr:hypothetical protein B0T21DRAFT_407933 [Apiosordaria backusii]
MRSLTLFTLRLLRIALLVACLALAVEAARGGGGSHGGGGSSSSGGGSSSSGGDTTGTTTGTSGSGYRPNSNDDSPSNNPNSASGSSSTSSLTIPFSNGNSGGYRYRNRNGSNNRPPFDIQQAINYRTIHGILASLAMVVLFPLGSIILRVLPRKWGLWVHAVFQILSTCIYVAAAAIGIHLVKTVKIPTGSLLTNSSTNYHPIIGLLLLALLLLQPLLGVLHHLQFRKLARRQIWSYLHLFNGRVGIALGIINGGLGLHLSQASNQKKTAYAIVASIIGAIWIGVSIWAEINRKKKLSDAEKAKEGEDEKMVKAATTGSEPEEGGERGRRSGEERKTGVGAWDIMK